MSIVDFRFCLTENNEGRYDISIQYQNDGKKSAILLDTTSAWIEHVKNELQKGLTAEEIVNEFRNGLWDDLENDPESGFRAQWESIGGTVCEKSFRNAVDQYFATLKAITDAVFEGTKGR